MHMFWGKLLHTINNLEFCIRVRVYNTRFVYCRELAHGIISLTGGWARGDGSKQYRYFFTLSRWLNMSHGMRKSVFWV